MIELTNFPMSVFRSAVNGRGIDNNSNLVEFPNFTTNEPLRGLPPDSLKSVALFTDMGNEKPADLRAFSSCPALVLNTPL